MNKKTTHFGYKTVSQEEKAGYVKDVFDSVSNRYDLMNDLMSGGLHRLWKKYTIDKASARYGQKILDLAGRTGDLAKVFAGKVGDEGHVVLADINYSMLNEGRTRLINSGISGNLSIPNITASAYIPEPPTIITVSFFLNSVSSFLMASFSKSLTV